MVGTGVRYESEWVADFAGIRILPSYPILTIQRPSAKTSAPRRVPTILPLMVSGIVEPTSYLYSLIRRSDPIAPQRHACSSRANVAVQPEPGFPAIGWDGWFATYLFFQ
jgi:hypothetical protein